MTLKKVIVLTAAEYKGLRLANMRSNLKFKFNRDLTQGDEQFNVTLTFDKLDTRTVCNHLERLVNFGATSAYEVLFA